MASYRRSMESTIRRATTSSEFGLDYIVAACVIDEAPNPDSFLVKAQTLFSEDREGGIEEIKKYYQKNKNFLEPRLKELRELLDKMK